MCIKTTFLSGGQSLYNRGWTVHVLEGTKCGCALCYKSRFLYIMYMVDDKVAIIRLIIASEMVRFSFLRTCGWVLDVHCIHLTETATCNQVIASLTEHLECDKVSST